ncbi:S9 family peptidase [Zymomonas mobilis]|uniref:alpha/beta hydrolase family protein n=1 Tax=Zymomonas mobilis TaxID=542 RepID=UPI0021AB81BE|nr:alpha/beta fold hydrolase [Zymomonas mobilis]
MPKSWLASLILPLSIAVSLPLTPVLSAVPISQSSAQNLKLGQLDQLMALPRDSQLTGAHHHSQWAFVRYQAGQHQLILTRPDPKTGSLPINCILADYPEDDGQPLYNITFSPDDSQLAYVRGGDPEFPDAPSPNPVPELQSPQATIHLVDIASSSDKIIASGYQPSFSPDGKILTYISQNSLWFYNPENHTPPEKLFTLRGHIRDLSWSPDGQSLVFVDDHIDHSFIIIFNLAAHRLHYLPSSFTNDLFPVFSPDSRKFAFIRATEPPPSPSSSERSQGWWSVMVANLNDFTVTEKWVAPVGRGEVYAGTRHQNLYWTAQNQILFPWEKEGWLHVYGLNPENGTVSSLMKGNFEVEQFIFDQSQNRLIYTTNYNNLDHYTLSLRYLSSEKTEQLGDQSLLAFQPAIANGQLAALVSDSRRPPYPALVQGKQFQTLISQKSTKDFSKSLAPVQSVQFSASDGKNSFGQFFSARDNNQRLHPTVIFLHGGPRRQMLDGFPSQNYYQNAYIFNQFLANNGYNVLSVNYRGGSGYGHDYREASETGRQGASEYRDILGAIHYLNTRKDVDSSHIAIWGGSWGGYLTALALARNSDIFKVGVDFHGVHNMLRPATPSLSPDDQREAQNEMWLSSPLASLEKWHSPVLLIHGDDDHNVPFSQSEELTRLLKNRGIPHEDLAFPNERHGFLLHRHWLEAYHKSFIFISRYLYENADKNDSDIRP